MEVWVAKSAIDFSPYNTTELMNLTQSNHLHLGSSGGTPISWCISQAGGQGSWNSGMDYIILYSSSQLRMILLSTLNM